MQNCYPSLSHENLDLEDETFTRNALKFVKEIVQENQYLKTRLSKLEKEHSKCTQSSDVLVLKESQTAEMSRTHYRKNQDKTLGQCMENECQSQGEQVQKLQDQVSNMWSELQRAGENAERMQEMAAGEQLRKELEMRLTVCQSEIQEIAFCEEKLKETKMQLNRVQQSEASLHRNVDKISTERQVLIGELSALRAEMKRLRMENTALGVELTQLRQQHNQLQPRRPLSGSNQMADNSNVGIGGLNFKDFIAVKRELLQLRSENKHLKEQLLRAGTTKTQPKKVLMEVVETNSDQI